MQKFVLILCAVVVAITSTGMASTRLVPQQYATIQSAVDISDAGDIILISPGVYREEVTIVSTRNLVLRGKPTQPINSSLPCWDAISRPALEIIIHGSISILSSSRITIEMLTVTGPGPGILIAGATGMPTYDVSIRYCNLLCNERSALEAVGLYHSIAVSCGNACLSKGENEILGTLGALPHQADLHVTCTLTYTDPAFEVITDPTAPMIVVAVIDSGIDRNIAPLACRMWVNPGEIPGNNIDDDGNGYIDDIHGWDFQDNDADSLIGTPIHWHGTFVAGVLADAIESYVPLRTEQARVRIMDLRFLNSTSLFYQSDWPMLVEAIDYAVDNGAKIINLSIYATSEPPDEVRSAIQRAIGRGTLVVGIAGNSGGVLGPIAAWEEVLTITAIDRNAQPAPFANRGDQVDLAALGVDVLSILPGGNLALRSGTSFAAPAIAGLAAMHLSENPNLSPAEIEALLKEGDS